MSLRTPFELLECCQRSQKPVYLHKIRVLITEIIFSHLRKVRSNFSTICLENESKTKESQNVCIANRKPGER